MAQFPLSLQHMQSALFKSSYRSYQSCITHREMKLASSWNTRKRFMKICEVLLVTCVLTIIIGLFTIPTVFYALSTQQTEVWVANLSQLHLL